MFVSHAVSGSNVKTTYKLGFLVPFNKGNPCVEQSARLYAQAIPVAMEKFKTMNYNFNLTWVWNDTMCNDESLAIQQQIWQLHNGVDAFVGPAKNCKHTLKTAVAFNKPVMSFVSRG